MHSDFTLDESSRVALTLSRALSIISDRYTNQGYRVKQDDGTCKVCIIGSINDASKELFGAALSYPQQRATDLVQEHAIRHFGISAVSVNDELGYQAVIKLLAITLEGVLSDAFDFNPDARRLRLTREGTKA
jgi:hypothetical protein